MTKTDEAQIRGESAGGPREYEDDAQKLATLELDGNLVVRMSLAWSEWTER